ncbi:MAG: DNA polymerase II large subunit, partial [Nanoarchaeota archaeon]
MNINEYFEELEREVKKNYDVAGEARKKGLDPSTSVEVPVATSLAERVLGLVSVLYPQINDSRIVQRILQLEKQYGPLDPAIALTIAEEIAKENFCKFKDPLEAIEAGIRIALGYMTLGYVSSPIEGFIQLKLKKTAKGEDYFAPYYSGPIRSAGGTEAAFSLVVVDYLREIFGYARYDPSDDEVKRGIHECYEYHERITNLQYLPSEQELELLLKFIPVQISGDASEEREVFNYKDLPRIETNFIRSGFTLVTGEGIAQKAPKILKRVLKLREKGFKLSSWDWLEEFVKLQKKIKESKKGDSSRAGATYIQDLVAGRQVYGHPSRSGAFRLRYGRARTSGYSTLALHPATMAATNGFIAVG